MRVIVFSYAAVGMCLDSFAIIRTSFPFLYRRQGGDDTTTQIDVKPMELLKTLIPVWFHPPYVSYWCNKATVQ